MLIFISLDELNFPKALSDLQESVLSEGGKGWNSAQSLAYNRYSINILELWRKRPKKKIFKVHYNGLLEIFLSSIQMFSVSVLIRQLLLLLALICLNRFSPFS